MISCDEVPCSVEPVDLTEQLADSLLLELAELCCFALDAEGGSSNWEVALVFTDDAHMSELHERFLGLRGPTDIMTFPSEEVRGGDVIISVDQADRQLGDEGWSLESELKFLVLHGVLHLTGWNDASNAERATMLQRQRAILADFHSKEPSSSR